MTRPQLTRLESVRAGDQESFAGLIEPYRNELLVHCYRILGSFQDAEDILQETLVRGLAESELVRRTFVPADLALQDRDQCLSGCPGRPQAPWPPAELYARGDPNRPLPEPSTQIIWVEAFPDTFIDEQPAAYPEARVEVRESITLAFVAALQKLPDANARSCCCTM